MTHRYVKKSWSVLAILLTMAGVSCAEQPADTSNAMCVTRLQLPVYPPIAQSARLSMSLTAVVALTSAGAAQTIAFEDISGERSDLAKLFFPELERSLRASQFSAACGGKSVRLIFDFRMNGDPPNKMIWFAFPNRFEIWDVSPPL
jgi:hypothetical protein